MRIHIDDEQAQVLREILRSSITQLRIESARTDTHAFREGLHHREELVANILAKLADAPA